GTTDVKTVKLGVSGSKAVLYNAAGQIVATGEFDINSLNIPSGLYILNANGETKKIIK
ncbi:MAG: T9SS type A sorting domain-containing protein, partial [Bacteroidaceae bacterium]|nr:T9SS type A sorting domain-containing protein [Bacteroidaceae bacterium]